MIVFFVYNILIFNYKDTKNYRDYQLFKRISYPELRFVAFHFSKVKAKTAGRAEHKGFVGQKYNRI